MSYDIWLERRRCRSKINDATMGQLARGGTYRVCSGNEKVDEGDLKLNITYNYAGYFYKVFGKKGIRSIYGMKAKDAREVLLNGYDKLCKIRDKEEKLGRPFDDDDYDRMKSLGEDWETYCASYWHPCAKNAIAAVDGLVRLTMIAPGFTFNGD